VSGVAPAYQSLAIVGLCLSEAYDFAWPRNAEAVHKHHKRPQGGLFACGIAADGVLVGVAIAARPNARCSDGTGKIGPRELWITRVAVQRDPPIPNACSMLYGAMRKAGAALGYSPVVTYTLASEPGTSMRAAGFRSVGERGGGRVVRFRTRKGHARPARPHAGRGTRKRRLPDRTQGALGVAVNLSSAVQSATRPAHAPTRYTATDARRNATAVFTETVIPSRRGNA